MARGSIFDVKDLQDCGMPEKAMHLYFVKTVDGVPKSLFVGLLQQDASFQVTFINKVILPLV